MTWKDTWRGHILPRLNREQLNRLHDALEANDPRLIQGNTVSYAYNLIRGACPIGYCAWDTNATPPDIYAFFYKIRGNCQIGAFLTWWDDGVRAEVFAELLKEVKENLLSLNVYEKSCQMENLVKEMLNDRTN